MDPSIKCRHYRGEVLFVHGSMFTYYGVDFGFVEEAKLRRAREIPPALESYRTTKYFGRKSMLIIARIYIHHFLSCEMLSV